MTKAQTITESLILEQIIAPAEPNLANGAARGLLGFKFNRGTTQMIRKLLQKNNRGTITTDERLALEKYLRVGQFLDLVHAKARLSLQKTRDLPDP